MCCAATTFALMLLLPLAGRRFPSSVLRSIPHYFRTIFAIQLAVSHSLFFFYFFLSPHFITAVRFALSLSLSITHSHTMHAHKWTSVSFVSIYRCLPVYFFFDINLVRSSRWCLRPISMGNVLHCIDVDMYHGCAPTRTQYKRLDIIHYHNVRLFSIYVNVGVSVCALCTIDLYGREHAAIKCQFEITIK